MNPTSPNIYTTVYQRPTTGFSEENTNFINGQRNVPPVANNAENPFKSPSMNTPFVYKGNGNPPDLYYGQEFTNAYSPSYDNQYGAGLKTTTSTEAQQPTQPQENEGRREPTVCCVISIVILIVIGVIVLIAIVGLLIWFISTTIELKGSSSGSSSHHSGKFGRG